jgi:hypothetical protein
MTRKQKFERRYGTNAAIVLSSIARVASAARWGRDPEPERKRHRQLMASLP